MFLVNSGVSGYAAALVLAFIAVVIASAILILNKILGERPKENTRIKGDAYECGVGYEGDARQQFSVRYYLIGIIFLIFDVEVVFMYPWALIYKKMLAQPQGEFILWEMAFFLLLVLVGYLYLRMRKALSWD